MGLLCDCENSNFAKVLVSSSIYWVSWQTANIIIVPGRRLERSSGRSVIICLLYQIGDVGAEQLHVFSSIFVNT